MKARIRQFCPVVVAVTMAATLLVDPAVAAAPRYTGLGVRLADAPAALRDDPRAHVYIIDHVPPGVTITRHMVVRNDTGRTANVSLYPDAASIQGGVFLPGPGHTHSELTDWISVAPTSLSLAQGEESTVTLKISVPLDAASGERYGVVYAELPPAGGNEVGVAARAGIRVYLDVGPGAPPPSDFVITTLTATRATDGSPVVRAGIKNTGGRALDMTGRLWLKAGPGGLNAGPFPAELGTTLGIGQEEPVTVKLDKQLPPGPWLAHLEMQSGLTKKAAEAKITFPTAAGTTGMTVKAKAVPLTKNKKVLGFVAGSLILLVVLGILTFLVLLWRRRRGKDESEANRPQPVVPGARSAQDHDSDRLQQR